MNQSLGYKPTLECFEVISVFNREQTKLFLASHGGSFEKFWEQAQAQHNSGRNGVEDSDLDSTIQTGDKDEIPTSPRRAKKHLSDALMSTLAELSDEEPHSDGENPHEPSKSDGADDAGGRKQDQTPPLSTVQASDSDDHTDDKQKKIGNSASTETSSTAPRRQSLAGPRLQTTPSHVCCATGHSLKCEVPDYDWTCDRCHTDYFEGEPVHVCHECEYDICDSCCRLACHIQHMHDGPIPYVLSSEFIGTVSDDDDDDEAQVSLADTAGGPAPPEAPSFHSASEISF